MNMQRLGEVATVCLFAMKLREESWDAEASRYGLSFDQASEDAVAEALSEHPPEVQKALAGLVYLIITSWNDTEGWATSIVGSYDQYQHQHQHQFTEGNPPVVKLNEDVIRQYEKKQLRLSRAAYHKLDGEFEELANSIRKLAAQAGVIDQPDNEEDDD